MYTIAYEEITGTKIKNEIKMNMSMTREVAILAIATVIEDTKEIIIDGILSILKEGQTDLFAYIEPERQLKLMKYCELNKRVPVIIHNHLYAENSVSFSPVDLQFIKSFQAVQNKICCESNSLFLVYGAGQVALLLMLNGKKRLLK